MSKIDSLHRRRAGFWACYFVVLLLTVYSNPALYACEDGSDCVSTLICVGQCYSECHVIGLSLCDNCWIFALATETTVLVLDDGPYYPQDCYFCGAQTIYECI